MSLDSRTFLHVRGQSVLGSRAGRHLLASEFVLHGGYPNKHMTCAYSTENSEYLIDRRCIC